MHLHCYAIALDELSELPDDVRTALCGERRNIMLRGALRPRSVTTRTLLAIERRAPSRVRVEPECTHRQ